MDVFVRLVIGFLDLQKISNRTYIYIYIRFDRWNSQSIC